MELFKGVPFIIIIIIRRSLLVLLVNRAFVTESLSLFKRRSLFATQNTPIRMARDGALVIRN